MLDFLDRSNRSFVLLALLLLVALLSGGIWSFSKMLASQDSLSNAIETLNKSQRLTAEIKRFRDRPRIASLENENATGMTNRVERAMKEAGITSTTREIQPGDAFQREKTNYKERSTTIKLSNISMQQVVQVCEHLEDPNEGLTVRDLVLTANLNSTNSAVDLWEVTITLSQLIYVPL